MAIVHDIKKTLALSHEHIRQLDKGVTYMYVQNYTINFLYISKLYRH